MEREEIKKLLTINRTSFPNFYKTMNENDWTILINSWLLIFGKMDKKTVDQAFMIALAKAEFPVVPANVLAVLNTQAKSNLPTTDELFDMAEKAGDKIALLYHEGSGWCDYFGDEPGTAKKKAYAIYDQLPPVLREWKHSPLDLMKWSECITVANQGFTRRDFKEVITDRLTRRETLGIDYNADFHPKWNTMLGCMKSLDDPKQIGGGEYGN